MTPVELQLIIELQDKEIADLHRVLDQLPCPVHGRCIPGALELLKRLTVAASFGRPEWNAEARDVLAAARAGEDLGPPACAER